jgi:hypothetical protein
MSSRCMFVGGLMVALRMVLSCCMVGLRCVLVVLSCFLMRVVCHRITSVDRRFTTSRPYSRLASQCANVVLRFVQTTPSRSTLKWN